MSNLFEMNNIEIFPNSWAVKDELALICKKAFVPNSDKSSLLLMLDYIVSISVAVVFASLLCAFNSTTRVCIWCLWLTFKVLQTKSRVYTHPYDLWLYIKPIK